MAAMLLTTVACDKSDPVKPVEPTEGEDTAEEIVLAVQNTYLLESFEEKDGYVLTFHNPSPIKLKKDYPDGIKSVTLLKGAVKSVTLAPSDVTLTFTDGKSAKLAFYAWIDAGLDSEFVSFGEDGEPRSIAYTINGSVPESAEVTVSVKGAEGVATYEITPDESGKGGLITFSLTGSGYFSKEVQVVFSNGEKSVSLPLSLVREDFKFADGSVKKSYAFKEYPRLFCEGLSKPYKGISVSIPEDATWISAEVHVDEYNGQIWLLLDENFGNTERKSTVTISAEGINQKLSIEISQIGSEMDGSLRKGLIALYKDCDGKNWEPSCNTNWCSDKPLTEWYNEEFGDAWGLRPFSYILSENNPCVLNIGEKIYEGTEDKWILSISGNMKGTIPNEFWQTFSSFVSFEIHNKNDIFSSTVPESIWHENLWDFQVTGLNITITPAILNAENLSTLNLHECNINTPFPIELTKLPNLRELNLTSCGISGTIPEELWELPKLAIIELSYNPELVGTLSPKIYDMEQLISFSIRNTKIGGTISSNISKLTNLGSFDIYNCKFEGTIPEEFGNLPKLEHWDFEYNYFTEQPQFIRYRAQYWKRAMEWDGWWFWMESGFPREGINPQRNKYGQLHYFAYPEWAHVKYGIPHWGYAPNGESKNPGTACTDDLQYPANEYYWDGKDWRHPNLEYPAREYYFDGKEWIHDASCPWEKEYIDPRLADKEHGEYDDPNDHIYYSWAKGLKK